MNQKRQVKTDDVQKVSFTEAYSLLTICWNIRRSCLVVGPPATAKTAVVHDFAAMNDFHVIVTTGATSLPTDPKGMPVSYKDDSGRTIADFIPYGDLRAVIEAAEPTIWVLEDFTNSDKDVQKGFMQILHERQVNEHKVSDQVLIVATGNRREDKSGVTTFLEAVKTRFAMIFEILPTLDSYLEWALPAGIHPDVTGYLKFRPEDLYITNPTNDMTREPNLRMWEFLSDTCHELDDLQLTPALQQLAVNSVCGLATGTNVNTYRALKDQLPDIDTCLADPHNCSLPDDTDFGIMVAFTSLLARRATLNNYGAILTIADRLPEEYNTKLTFDANSINPELKDTPEWLDWSAKHRSTFLN